MPGALDRLQTALMRIVQSPASTVVSTSEAVRRDWDAYVSGCPRATFFHLAGWGAAIERTFGYPSHSLTATIDGKVVGILPLYLVKNFPFGRSLVSTPMAVYGGPCADSEEVLRSLLQAAQDLARARHVRYLELRNERAVPDLPVKELYVTFKKEIDPDPDKNMGAIPRNQRRSIRIGIKSGLSSRVGGSDLLADFYHVYSTSVRNLGSPVFPLRLFENLLEEFGERCKILGVFKDEKMIAGVMTFLFRDQILPYYGGAYREGFRYGVNDFMYWSLLCHGAENGLRIFDFGRSKEGSGSYNFKRHWGFEPTPLPYQYYLVAQKELPDLSPHNPKFSLPIRIWKRLPLGVTRWLGPKIVRYFR